MSANDLLTSPTLTPVTLQSAFISDSNRHVALTISGSTHTLYLDGTQVGINLSGGNMLTYGSAIPKIYIGCAGDLSYGFTGIIDDFKIWNRALPLSEISVIYNANKPFYFYDNFYNGVTTNTRFLNGGGNSNTVTFTTNIATWSYYTTNPSALNIFRRGNTESNYFFNGRDAALKDANAWSIFIQTVTGNTSTFISTPINLSSSGKYILSFAAMHTRRATFDYTAYTNIKVSFGDSYIIFRKDNNTYESSGNVSISSFFYDLVTSTYTTPSTLMKDNPAINNMKFIGMASQDLGYLAFITLTFQNMSNGTNVLKFEAINNSDGFMVSQIKVTN